MQIGGQNKVIIQSMTNTLTKNVTATVRQIKALEAHDCPIVRLAITDLEDAKAIAMIKKSTNAGLVADIHFDFRLALAAIDYGVDKIRINPGNIGSKIKTQEVVLACKDKRIPIRIGVNSGSLDSELLSKHGGPTAIAMLESAQKQLQILEDLDFYDICLSFKASNPELCIQAYQLAAQTFPYPLHLGVTEAGSLLTSSVRSSAAIGSLLYQGIGDTLRISVSGDPIQEIKIAKELLACFNLIDDYPKIISCPTCGRNQWNMLEILPAVEEYLSNKHGKLTVAIMGCGVNGPGEAREADIGLAGGKDEVLLFKSGQIVRKIAKDDILKQLFYEIDNYLANN